MIEIKINDFVDENVKLTKRYSSDSEKAVQIL